MDYEDLLYSIVQAVNDLVESFNTIQVFGVGFFTWLLVFFFAVFVIIPVIVRWPYRGWLE